MPLPVLETMANLLVHGGRVVLADVSVGRDSTGEGSLSMTGGRVEAGDVSIGRLAGSRGLAILAGGELARLKDTLYVGREGATENSGLKVVGFTLPT